MIIHNNTDHDFSYIINSFRNMPLSQVSFYLITQRVYEEAGKEAIVVLEGGAVEIRNANNQ